jgi:hypothetical protein
LLSTQTVIYRVTNAMQWSMISRRLVRSILGYLAHHCGSNYFAANPD